VKRLALTALVLATAGCGGTKTFDADAVRACVPRGSYQHVLATREEGVTSLNYAYANGGEADVSVFPSAHDAAGRPRRPPRRRSRTRS